jgi:chromosome segregation ATPase
MSDNTREFEIPAIKPAQDEVASYRRSGRSEAPRQSNFNGVLVFVIMLMAIMMSIGGFALWQVQQKLDQSNRLLAKGQSDLHDLEDRLSQTGDTASKKFKEMESQIKTNVSEIDKLWAGAYRQQRADIKDNKSAIAGLDKKVDELNASVAQFNIDFGKLSSDMAKLKEDVATDSDDVSTQMSLVRGEVQDQSVTLEGNKRSIAALHKQVKDLQDAVNVIDKYRQQINQRILDLQAKVQGSTGSAPSP